MSSIPFSGQTNNEFVDNLLQVNYIKTSTIERVFRVVDRAEYILPEYKSIAYKQMAWRSGNLHLSAPSIYGKVMEELCLQPSLSFLNLGSGTGYLSTMVGLILGRYGINHGIEYHTDVVQYANKRLEDFKIYSRAIGEIDFCEPEFIQGNCLCLTSDYHAQYDRIYCGAACPKQYETYMKNLMKIGGILIMPFNDQLIQMKRTSETHWETRSLLSVSFASLIEPTPLTKQRIQMRAFRSKKSTTEDSKTQPNTMEIRVKPRAVSDKSIQTDDHSITSTDKMSNKMLETDGKMILNDPGTEKIHDRIASSENIKELDYISNTEHSTNSNPKIAEADKIGQDQFDQRILKFVINTMGAVSILGHPHFIQLFDGLNLHVMSRNTAMEKISELSSNIFRDIKTSLQDVPFVCTTVDIWSCKKISFLGVTGHWIDETTLQRKSVALACKRFSGTPSFDKIVETLNDINDSFTLSQIKIVGTVTDNGLNFLKVFKEFGVNLEQDIVLQSVLNESGAECNIQESKSGVVEVKQDDENEDELIAPVPIIQENDHHDIVLLNHFQCITHTISLIATTDVNKTINTNDSLRRKHTAVMNKCSLLWNKCVHPKSAYIIKETLEHCLSYPVTGWNSYYDALLQILKEKDKLNTLFEKLDLKNQMIEENDLEYIEEFTTILKPLAHAIDILQGEQNAYFGSVLPTIGSLTMKFIKMKSQNFRHLSSIVDTCLTSLNVRFGSYLTFTNVSRFALIATTTHPKFKLRWLPAFKDTDLDLNINDLKKIVIEGISELAPLEGKSENESSNGSVEDQFEDEFFEFGDDTVKKDNNNTLISTSKCELQFLQYLQDPGTNIDILNKYPFVKRAFIKYNTVLPSSAPVERIFSYITFVDAPRYNALSDKDFENLIILKANKI